MHLYNSARPDKPEQIFSTLEDDGDDDSQDLSLCNSSSTRNVVGCDLVGKLIDRMVFLVEECF